MVKGDGKLGFIGGSGIYDLDAIKIVKEHTIETPYGKPSDNVVEAKLGDFTFYFLPRHGRGHRVTPSEINYRANIFALKKVGVDKIVSVSAVGSLKEELPPRTFVLPDQFIDWTKGLRERTFFGKDHVGHVSVAVPIEKGLQDIVAESCKACSIEYKVGGSYICIEGPQFSSKAESNIYRGFGASVIGMTNVPESYLAKEAGIAYVTIAMVTDYDCWKDEHCTVEEIMKVMKDNNLAVNKLVVDLVPRILKSKFQYKSENQYAIMTKESLIPAEVKETLKVLLS